MLRLSSTRLSAMALGLTVTILSANARAFEGELKAKLSGQPGTSMRVHAWYSADGDVRIDISGKSPDGQLMKGSTIMPAKGESYYSISHNQKVIVEVPYAALRASSEDVAKKPEANLEIEKVGTETVSGIKTEHVRVLDKDNNATIDLWMTPKYPPDLWTQAFRGRNVGLEISDEERIKAMKRYGIEPGFAMKMQVRQPGRPAVKFLVEEIKQQSVPKQQFALPSGYERLQGAASSKPSPAPPTTRPNP